jgi:hypothetical protein
MLLHLWKRRAAGGQAIAAKTYHSRLKALADGNGKGSEDGNNKGNKENKGNEGEGKEGNEGNFPEGVGR